MDMSGFKYYTGKSVPLKIRIRNTATGRINPFIITLEQRWKEIAEIFFLAQNKELNY